MHRVKHGEVYDAVPGGTVEPVLGGPELERQSAENSYELAWVPLAEIANRLIRPDSLREWMGERDWSRFPAE